MTTYELHGSTVDGRKLVLRRNDGKLVEVSRKQAISLRIQGRLPSKTDSTYYENSHFN